MQSRADRRRPHRCLRGSCCLHSSQEPMAQRRCESFSRRSTVSLSPERTMVVMQVVRAGSGSARCSRRRCQPLSLAWWRPWQAAPARRHSMVRSGPQPLWQRRLRTGTRRLLLEKLRSARRFFHCDGPPRRARSADARPCRGRRCSCSCGSPRPASSQQWLPRQSPRGLLHRGLVGSGGAPGYPPRSGARWHGSCFRAPELVASCAPLQPPCRGRGCLGGLRTTDRHFLRDADSSAALPMLEVSLKWPLVAPEESPPAHGRGPAAAPWCHGARRHTVLLAPGHSSAGAGASRSCSGRHGARWRGWSRLHLRSSSVAGRVTRRAGRRTAMRRRTTRRLRLPGAGAKGCFLACSPRGNTLTHARLCPVPAAFWVKWRCLRTMAVLAHKLRGWCMSWTPASAGLSHGALGAWGGRRTFASESWRQPAEHSPRRY